MNTDYPEQIKEVAKRLDEIKAEISEIEAMMSDIGCCSSETSKKYLQAAIVKHASKISYTSQPTTREA